MYIVSTLSEGLTSDLLWATIWTGLVCFWIASRNFSIDTAFFLVAFKVSIPCLYFAFFYDGTWNLNDDLEYQKHGIEMLQSGYNPITGLLTTEGWHQLRYLAGGNHLLYSWWNLLGNYFFGKHYYSPVFLNITLTFIAGHFLFRLALLTGFNRKYTKTFILFFLSHWELLVWSSFINLKDVLVMTITVISLYCIINFFKKPNLKDLTLLLFSLYLFFWLRVYITFVIIIATIIWFVLSYRGQNKLPIIFLILSLSSLIFYFAYASNLSRALSILNNLKGGFTGLFRMSITPQPWSIVEKKSFLFLPSILHWLFYLPALWGLWILWHRSREISLLIIYLFLCLFLYGTFPEKYQGPRRRVQVTFIIAWAQFHSLWLITKKKSFTFKKSPK